MIPQVLRTFVGQQRGQLIRRDPSAASKALAELEIPQESEFGEFFHTYEIGFFRSPTSYETLVDLVEPNREIYVGTKFVREVWGLPENFIAISSIEGEGAYLYDRESGEVFDFELRSRDEFLRGKRGQKWNSFFEFMIWYLGGAAPVAAPSERPMS